MKPTLLKLTAVLLIIILFCCGQLLKAQSYPLGILWVVPIDSSALPINNTITGNVELNKIFEEFHVETYAFLCNNLFYDSSLSFYEIRLKESYADLEEALCVRLNYFEDSLFYFIIRPYPYNTSNIFISVFHPSAQPCSPTRSCNDEINAILDRYNILSYEHAFPDDPVLVCSIRVFCDNSSFLPLYNDLLPLTHLFEYLVPRIYFCDPLVLSPHDPLREKKMPCELNVADTEPKLPIVSPNPVQDYVTISGINPQLITLSDAQGKVLLTQKDDLNRIDMRRFPKGFYFMHILSDMGTIYTQKLIKQ